MHLTLIIGNYFFLLNYVDFSKSDNDIVVVVGGEVIVRN